MKERYVILTLAILFFVGLVGHLWLPTRQLMLTITPFTLLLLNVLALYPSGFFHRSQNRWWLILVALFTLTAEIIGVNTGLLFGSYGYGQVLGVSLLGVPLIIGLNWAVVIAGCGSWVDRWGMLPQVILGAALATAFDAMLEPIAIRLGYWHWSDGSVPLTNYVTWFGLSLLSILLLKRLRVTTTGSVLRAFVLLEFMFFAMLYLLLSNK